MKRVAAIVAVVAVVVSPCLASGATRGTPTEAKDMLQQAKGHFKSVGRTQALADFSAGKAPFRDRDLYVVCVSADHRVAANGAFPAYIGTSADALVDAKGNPLGRALWDAAAKEPDGAIDYPMINPATGKMESKSTSSRRRRV